MLREESASNKNRKIKFLQYFLSKSYPLDLAKIGKLHKQYPIKPHNKRKKSCQNITNLKNLMKKRQA